ncbi:MAG: hypothetical protein CMN85_16250 [Spongiibacteraceae bacterium]|nr:hypothetical protein [Spongiibacteraceae bacterium]
MHPRKLQLCGSLLLATGIAALISPAYAHDPVFGIGPHVLFKDGVELKLGAHVEKSDRRETEYEFEFKYGITGDWVAGASVGDDRSTGKGPSDSGRAATTLSTKYRFWRNDQFAAQESAALFGKVILDDADTPRNRVTEPDGNDYILGLAYGYEGRKWYRWASVRHRFNADTRANTERPDVWLVDIVGGIRFFPTGYYEPDWVWMLELNGEIVDSANPLINGNRVRLGGDSWFLSPGLMWTYRNIAIKTGVQLPVYDTLAGDQEPDDYRAVLELEWHL